jgi:hypothetical protein
LSKLKSAAHQVKKDLFFDVVGIGFPAPPHPQALSTDVDDTEIRKTKREDGELAIAAVLAQVAMGDVIPIYYTGNQKAWSFFTILFRPVATVEHGAMYFVFCRLYPSSPRHHDIDWVLPVISLLLTNTGPKKKTIVGLLVFNPLCYSTVYTFLQASQNIQYCKLKLS